MIFVVSPSTQNAEVNTFCFERCKKITLAGLETVEYGWLMPCREKDCPYEAERTGPILNMLIHNEEAWVRTLTSDLTIN